MLWEHEDVGSNPTAPTIDHAYHAAMDRATVMTFATLDEAESALDWIGLDFAEGEGAFEGQLVAGDGELLAEALDDPEAPEPVRALASLLRNLLAAHPDDAAWRVTFPAQI